MTWADILAHEPLIEADLHQVYGVDLEDALAHRSWRWLKVRILGLLSTDCRLFRALDRAPAPAPGGE